MEVDQTGSGTSEAPEPETKDKDVSNDPDYVSKHSAIFSKFKKAAQTAHESEEEEEEEQEDAVETQDLAPLPQPELPSDAKLVSTDTHKNNLDWLATPTFIDPELKQPFEELGVTAPVLKNLRAMGFSSAFSVQVGTLRLIMEDIRRNRLAPDFRGDLLVNASTGSGKTLAYSIPVIEALYDRVVPRVRAIILVPTKPLITQVSQTLRDLSNGTTLSIVSLTSDLSIREEGIKITTNIPDVIVSTPGRLVDHLLNGSISLEALRFLIIDEADRLLNQSFQNWSNVVVSNLEKWVDPALNTSNIWRLQTQKMIFSATLTTDAGKLSLLKFNSPRLLVVNNSKQLVREMFSVPVKLHENRLRFTSSKTAIKPLILAKFMMQANKLSSVLVFANSNDATLRLSKVLQNLFNKLVPNKNITVAYMNSTNNVASVRGRLLKDFAEKRVHVLVATDLIARGLDILSITDVINYDLPNSSREYVH
ncbi:hypothetical protein CLUG_04109 [Clavispora lusitaniae ATCC 42720]|uniref:ATP-dependent RNA helicase n=2 Tax=Clavispora lusitaniae TaxID=36911 RepID=C4Y7D1_CLAL4|nr:uncharacterized protein CLUG_04109 [Clavispora lusitaniae ATCC 42720]EEQ39981.1 hypothetical protein CLUG_04109 [Clavispora lusitaniae ATCC 42720]